MSNEEAVRRVLERFAKECGYKNWNDFGEENLTYKMERLATVSFSAGQKQKEKEVLKVIRDTEMGFYDPDCPPEQDPISRFAEILKKNLQLGEKK